LQLLLDSRQIRKPIACRLAYPALPLELGESDVTLRNLFTEHPATAGETYWQHLGAAWGFSWRLMAASLACLVHALLPFLFVKTGSRAITELHDRMVANRQRHAGQDAPATERRAA
jgi:hypothetical protein